MNVKLKPVCERGYTFDKIYVLRLKVNEHTTPFTIFIPSYCPNCGKTISDVIRDCFVGVGVVDEEQLAELRMSKNN